ncbi:MAG: SPOR domain-containing protein [Gammaproteobacteria bacterium]|nr:SPOR domain-containing protein [Gammaproteobacteria bacterium]MCW5583237.1 SPOR domain-containing protein [Gammaproteobacteria bacterium]
MESRVKHRILGMLVIIGLVIILLPLFQGGKELSPNTVLVKAPPFPNQPAQVTAVNTMVSPPAPSPVESSLVVMQDAPMAPQPIETTENAIHQQPDDIISIARPSIINDTSTSQVQLSTSEIVQSEMIANKSSVTEAPTTISTEPAKTSHYRIIEGEKAASLLKKSAHKSKTALHKKPAEMVKTKIAKTTKVAPGLNQSIDDDGLIKLKGAVWVIQIGSFQNKANALRVVNQLRENGYHAFIQQISTALGSHTRVFVGPENKRATARALADRLQHEMHMQGILITYKPLVL